MKKEFNLFEMLKEVLDSESSKPTPAEQEWSSIKDDVPEEEQQSRSLAYELYHDGYAHGYTDCANTVLGIIYSMNIVVQVEEDNQVVPEEFLGVIPEQQPMKVEE